MGLFECLPKLSLFRKWMKKCWRKLCYRSYRVSLMKLWLHCWMGCKSLVWKTGKTLLWYKKGIWRNTWDLFNVENYWMALRMKVNIFLHCPWKFDKQWHHSSKNGLTLMSFMIWFLNYIHSFNLDLVNCFLFIHDVIFTRHICSCLFSEWLFIAAIIVSIVYLHLIYTRSCQLADFLVRFICEFRPSWGLYF